MLYKLLTVMRQFNSYAIFIISIVIGHGPIALAHSQPMTVSLVLDVRSVPGGYENTCKDIFTGRPEFQTMEHRLQINSAGQSEFFARNTTTEDRSPLVQPLVEQVLDNWKSNHDRLTEKQTEMLLARDSSLDPRRSMYIQKQTREHLATIRIFDGSTKVFKGGQYWFEASLSSNLTPIEINNPGFLLPEHYWEKKLKNKPAYLWELGLLDIDRNLKDGVDAVFNQVAWLLDVHYNNLEFGALGKIENLKQKNMMIYGQTRPYKLEIFRKFGFQPVITINSRGEPSNLEPSPGLVLIQMNAVDFLKRYYSGHDFVAHKSQSKPFYEQEKLNRVLKEKKERINEMDRLRIPIQDFKDVQYHASQIFRMYVSARNKPGRSPEQNQSIVEFFQVYLAFLNSIPGVLRHPNGWTSAKNVVIHALISGETPFDSFFVFAHTMDNFFKEDKTMVVNNLTMQEFYKKKPGVIKMMTPTVQPMTFTFVPEGANR